MRVFTTLPQENLAKVGAAAQAIEAAGYTGVSTQENKHEPFLSLAVAGAATKHLELHTGKITPRDHEAERTRLRAEAAEALRELDELG